ncbi:hypothetical protein FQZ97_682740 [compost metagenome]
MQPQHLRHGAQRHVLQPLAFGGHLHHRLGQAAHGCGLCRHTDVGGGCRGGHGQQGPRQQLVVVQLFEEVIGQVAHVDHAALADHHHRRAQQVVKLAEVAGPGVALEEVHHWRRHAHRLAALAQRKQDLLHHEFEVASLAQRGQAHHQAVEAVVEVFAEVAARDHVLDVLVGGADHGHVHVHFLASPQRADPALLQHAQQPRLQVLGHVTDFVEEQRAAVGLQDLADGALLARTGEGAFFIAEQLGLDQRLGNRCAVDRNEGLTGTVRVTMDRLREQVFAGAGFAQDHDRDVLARHHAQLVDHRRHLGVTGVQVLQR